MQKRLNINGSVLSLSQPPSSCLSSQTAQSWCQRIIETGVQTPVVWFLQDAVYHVLRPPADVDRMMDAYEIWKVLHKQGVKLVVCQSACARRLPSGSLDDEIFELSTLTQWAADMIRQAEAKTTTIYCIVDEPALSTQFLREKIDQVLSLLALEISVCLVFTTAAVDHLLDEKHWRKWRMLPETEDCVSLFVCTEGLLPECMQSLIKKSDVQLLSADELAEITTKGCCVYV